MRFFKLSFDESGWDELAKSAKGYTLNRDFIEFGPPIYEILRVQWAVACHLLGLYWPLNTISKVSHPPDIIFATFRVSKNRHFWLFLILGYKETSRHIFGNFKIFQNFSKACNYHSDDAHLSQICPETHLEP